MMNYMITYFSCSKQCHNWMCTTLYSKKNASNDDNDKNNNNENNGL